MCVTEQVMNPTHLNGGNVFGGRPEGCITDLMKTQREQVLGSALCSLCGGG